MNKLTEEKEKAIRLDVFTRWLEDYKKKNKKNPDFEEMKAYCAELETRQAPKSPEALIDLEREEEKIRRYARKIMFNEMIPFDRIVIHLMPHASGKTIVYGGHPSKIHLGFTSKELDFRGDLRRLIRRAHKVWEPAALILSTKMYEYKRDLRKFASYKDDPDYYPIIPEERLQVRMYELVKLIDMKTGEVKIRSRETEIGQFKHFRNNPLVSEARLDLSRQLYANGKLTDEELTYEPEEKAISMENSNVSNDATNTN